VRQDAEVAALAGADGVAVRRRFHHDIETEHAAGAGPVLDDHRLSETLLHLRGDQARHDIHGIARWKGHDDLDRLVGQA
jgi:hypothetical protein